MLIPNIKFLVLKTMLSFTTNSIRHIWLLIDAHPKLVQDLYRTHLKIIVFSTI